MSDERFFEQVKTQFEGFSPEVPQGVYGGMRRKLWWSKFSSPDMHRFNMWYLLLLVGMASAGAYTLTSSKSVTAASMQEHQPAPAVQTEMPTESVAASPAVSCGHLTAGESKAACTGSDRKVECGMSKMCDTGATTKSETTAQVGTVDDQTSAGINDIGDQSVEPSANAGASPVTADAKSQEEETNATAPSTDKTQKRKPLRVPVYGNKK